MLAAIELPEDLMPIGAALEATLARVSARFDSQLQSELSEVSELIGHLGGYRGKMLRPSMVLLFAMALGDHRKPFAERVTEEHVISAAVVEMVHVATLVHDDVLDEAEMRRKAPTISHLRGNEAAVILGDYLIASAYELASQIEDQRTSLAVARASMTVCAGELLQLSHRDDLEIDRKTYFDIIDRKTGELVALSCELGSLHAGAGEDIRHEARRFGQLLGQAFQIQDDLLDLTGDASVVGKSVGRDLDMGKLTLPMIRFLEVAGEDDRARFQTLMGAIAGGDHAGEQQVREMLAGSIDIAVRDAGELVESARGCLDSLPTSEIRATLDIVAQSVLGRKF